MGCRLKTACPALSSSCGPSRNRGTNSWRHSSDKQPLHSVVVFGNLHRSASHSAHAAHQGRIQIHIRGGANDRTSNNHFDPFLFAHRKNCQMFIWSDRIALDLYQQSVGFCVYRPRVSHSRLGRSAPLFLDRRHSYRARRGVSTKAHENGARQTARPQPSGSGSCRPSPERWPAPTLTLVVNLPPWGMACGSGTNPSAEQPLFWPILVC